MSILKSAALLVATILGYLIAADIAGVIVSLVFDILPLQAISTPLFYVVWFVIGVFCGFLMYQSGGKRISRTDKGVDWSAAPGSRLAGLIVIATTAVILIGLSMLFYMIWWRGGVEAGDHYVPDNIALTITFFVAILGAMILGHGKPRTSPPKNDASA